MAICLFGMCLAVYALLMAYTRWNDDEGDSYLEGEVPLAEELPSSNWHCGHNLTRTGGCFLCNPQAFPTRFPSTCQLYSIGGASDDLYQPGNGCQLITQPSVASPYALNKLVLLNNGTAKFPLLKLDIGGEECYTIIAGYPTMIVG